MSSLNPSTYGQSVTFTASINGANGLLKHRNGKTNPLDVTGSVTWSDSNGPLTCTETGNSTTPVTSGNPGTTTCTTAALLVNPSDTITGNYSGDSNHNPGSGTVSQAINAAGANVSVMSSLNPSTYGQSVTFTASISGAGGMLKHRNSKTHPLTVTGSVTWSDSHGPMTCTETGTSTTPVTAGNPGTATCTTAALGGNPSDTITANYSGDSNNNPGSGTVNQTITKATPTVSFTGLPSTDHYNSQYTLTATTNASTTAVIADSTGTVCSLTGTTVMIVKDSGMCKVTATWAADSNYTSATASQTGTAAKGLVTINWATPAPITYGTALSATQLDAAAIPAGGTYVYTPAAGAIEAVGNVTLKVTYHPSNLNYAVTTDTVVLQVQQAATTTTITSADKTVTLNVHGTATATMDFNVSSYKPNGAVTLTASTGESCAGTVAAATGNGHCNLVFNSTGTRTLTATYSGDANHMGSNNSTQSPAITVTVNPYP